MGGAANFFKPGLLQSPGDEDEDADFLPPVTGKFNALGGGSAQKSPFNFNFADADNVDDAFDAVMTDEVDFNADFQYRDA